MADPKAALRGFREEIDQALELLLKNQGTLPPEGNALKSITLVDALPSLLQQCVGNTEMVRDARKAALVMRSIHHFACTGGTLISRCIAAMPNTRVLSEVDPLSGMAHKHAFVPTDLIGLAKFGSRPPSEQVLIDIFRAGLDVLARDARHRGISLILRDHSHSHFCVGDEIPERPTLREILAESYETRALVTVRHPLDSFLSAQTIGWLNFKPGTIEEYARRYIAFLDRYADATILRYEDFVTDPDAEMQRICTLLDITFNSDFQHIFPAVSLSGDSGRKGTSIAVRPRRSVPRTVTDNLAHSPTYATLCARLGYDPDPAQG